MNTSVKRYCTRESMIPGIQWIGGDAAFRLIRGWGADVARSDTNQLVLQEPDRTAVLSPGDYIVEVNGSYYKFTPEEMQENYVEVTE